MVRLSERTLERLRDRLRERGQRKSSVFAVAVRATEVIEAMHVVEEYGALCEAMYLVMLADGRVSNVERDVLRGALRVLSNDRVRSTHMESMVDVAARNVAEDGFDKRLAYVVDRLREEPARAELAYVLAAAVAAADGVVVPSEKSLLARLADGLGLDNERVNRLLDEMSGESA